VDAAPQIEGYTLTLRPDLRWQTDRIVTERVRFAARAWTRYERAWRSMATSALKRCRCPPIQPAHCGVGAENFAASTVCKGPTRGA
jgi:hypothetical protein